jgi:hypothetical protein
VMSIDRWLLGLLVLALLAGGYFWWWRRSRQGELLEPSAASVAWKELNHLEKDLLSGQDTYHAACSRLHDILRRYLERELAIPATRRTVDELDALSAGDARFSSEFSIFLRELDGIRFAPESSSAETVGQHLQRAKALVARAENNPIGD